MTEKINEYLDDDLAVQEAKPALKRPPLYKVILVNDDFTPMEFVIWSLVTFFSKSEPEANSITLEIHKLGSALAGIYDYQIAESKVFEVMEIARENDYPLKVTGEPAD